MKRIRLVGWRATRALFREAGGVARENWAGLTGSTGAVILASLVLHGFDHPMGDWLQAQRPDELATLARGLSRWGELHFAPALALISLWAAGRLWHRREWVLASLAGIWSAITAGIAANVIKIIVGRPRPFTGVADGFHWFHTGWEYGGFPSGHAAHCFAMVGAVGMLAPCPGLVLAVCGTAVAWSRFYLGRHYLSDIFMGAVLGLTVGALFGLAARRLAKIPAEAAASGNLKPVSLPSSS